MFSVSLFRIVVIFAVVSTVSLEDSADDLQSKPFQKQTPGCTDMSFFQYLFMEERKARQSLEKTVEDLGRMMQELQKTVTEVANQTKDEEVSDITCPMGFTQYGSKCYRVFDVHASWIEAKMYCRVLGTDLAVIGNFTTHDNLRTLLNAGHRTLAGYWLDGSDMPKKDTWYWIEKNDKVYQQFTYSKWHPQEPEKGIHEPLCMGVWRHHGWLWHAYPCHLRDQGFICQA